MNTLAKLAIALALSWYVADRIGMTPMDGINTLADVADKLG